MQVSSDHRQLVLAFTGAVLAGTFGVVGWAPLGWWPSAIVSFIILFYLVLASPNLLVALLVGIGFSFGLYGVGQAWVSEPLHRLLGFSWPRAISYHLFLVVCLTPFLALPCMLTRWLLDRRETDGAGSGGQRTWNTQSSLIVAAIFGAALTLGEWARSLPLSGYTALSLGESLVSTWYAGYAPLFGLYGVSMIAFFSAALVLMAVINRGNARKWITLIGLALPTLGYLLLQCEWVQPVGAPMNYSLVQANLNQGTKFDPAFREHHIQRVENLIAKQPATLVVTSEMAFPLYFHQMPPSSLARLQHFASEHESHLFLGIPTSSATGDSFNSVVHIKPDGAPLSQYNKTFLMPVGEYTPSGLAWLGSSLDIPFKNLSPGQWNQATFKVNGQAIAPLVCQEESARYLARHWLPEADFFINPSNLSWFDGSLAIEQRFQSVQMRALETGRPILRATNSGITAHIDHNGVPVKQLPSRENGVLSGKVQPMTGLTPYARFGDWFVVLASLALLVFSIRRRPSTVLENRLDLS